MADIYHIYITECNENYDVYCGADNSVVDDVGDRRLHALALEATRELCGEAAACKGCCGPTFTASPHGDLEVI